MKTIGIIQARMSSSRLPGKVLRKIQGQSMLQYVCEAVSRSDLIDEVTIATSDEPSDIPVVKFAKQNHWNYVCGSLTNVAQRFLLAAEKHDADVIARICGDSPLIDHRVIDAAVSKYLNWEHQIVCNVRPRTFPYGCSVEVFSVDTLRRSVDHANHDGELEHVTPAIYREFPTGIFNLTHQPDLSRFRLTVDTLDDFYRIERLIQQLGGNRTEATIEQITDQFDLVNEAAA